MAESVGNSSQTTGPLTLNQDGSAPACRMVNAQRTQDYVQRLVDADSDRSRKRAAVDGLVDGNPPYKPANLKRAGQSDRANFNPGTGRSWLENATGAFYDLTSQAPGIFCIQTSYGDRDHRTEWSRTMSEIADRLIRQNKTWNVRMQLSQMETVLHGTGPLLFEDHDRVIPRFVPTENLLAPDRAPCNTDEWDIAAVLVEYYPPQLYEFIMNEEAARHVGWDVEYTKEVIIHAVDKKMPDQRTYTWEWYQNELKSNSFDYVDETLCCRLAHVYWQEFPVDGKPGRITHAIVERSTSTGVAKYLYINVGQFDNWDQCVHPMYYDRGRAGLHHNVTGLGVKMFGLLEYQMRLFLNSMDKAFGPKLLFKCLTAEARQKFQIAKLGEYGVLPVGTEYIQTPTNGFMQDGLAMFRETESVVRSNLGQYRQPVQMDKPGNPKTAKEVTIDASAQGSLANTTFDRYYEQLDALYAEMIRRMCNLNSSDALAKDFQRECIEHQVPRECLGRIASVTAVRTIGQGNPYMRQDIVASMAPVANEFSEDGHQNWLDDLIASRAGAAQVNRWNPKKQTSRFASDQKVGAMLQVSQMRQGMPTTFSPSQNATTYAGVFLGSCIEAINSIPKGANPQEILRFVDQCAPAAGVHIRRLLKDPMRHQIGEDFNKKLHAIISMVDKLKRQMAQQQKKQQAQAQKTQQVMSDQQLAQIETRAKIQDRALKTRYSLQEKAMKARQQMALNDAKTAADIRTNHVRALSQ